MADEKNGAGVVVFRIKGNVEDESDAEPVRNSSIAVWRADEYRKESAEAVESWTTDGKRHVLTLDDGDYVIHE